MGPSALVDPRCVELGRHVHSDFWVGGGVVGEAGECAQPNVLIHPCCGTCTTIRCGASLRSRCPSCAAIYKGRVRTLCAMGITQAAALGGTLTLTAPGVGRHCRRHRRCEADGPDCDRCPCSVDSLELGEWNASLGKRWNRLLQAIRRGEASPKYRGRRQPQAVQYVRVLEPQQRGALHLHVPIVSGNGEPIVLSPRKLRALAIRKGFGHSLHWDPMTGGKHEAAKLGGYVAKYVTKSLDERAVLPWKWGDDVPNDVRCRGPRLRVWVASRGWCVRMGDLNGRSRKAVPRRHDVEVERSEKLLAVGEPLDSLLTGYTVDRAPPARQRVQLRLFTLQGRGGDRSGHSY